MLSSISSSIRLPSSLITKCAYLSLSAIISQSAAAEPTKPVTPLSHTLGGFELTLNNKNSQCQLQTLNKTTNDTKTLPLLLETPCYWITKSTTNQLLHYDYKDVAADMTLLVAGNPLDWSAEKKAYQKLTENAYCTQYLQGIVISKDQVFAVHEKMIAAHCETGLAIDEKIFYAMAYNPKRYQETLDIPVKKQVKTKTDTPKDTEENKEKSFIDSVTQTVKGFFSGKTENAQ